LAGHNLAADRTGELFKTCNDWWRRAV